MTEKHSNELRDYVNVIRQHQFKIVLAFLLSAGSAIIAAYYLPPTYEASTLIEVRTTTSAPSVSTNLFQSVLSGGINRGDLETLVRRFTTESLLTSAVDALETSSNPGARYLPSIGRLRASVQARTVPDTSYVVLGVRLPEIYGGERNAAIVSNQLVKTLQEWRALEERQGAASRRSILDEHLADLHTQLEQQQRKLLKFMQDNGSPATWYPVLDNLLERQMELLTNTRAKQVYLETLLDEQVLLHKHLADQPEFQKASETVTADPLWSGLRSQLLRIEADIAEAKSRYGDESDELRGLLAKQQTLMRQFDELAQQSTASVTDTLSPLYLELVQSNWNMEARILGLRKELSGLTADGKKLDLELEQLLQSLPAYQYDFDLAGRKIETLYTILIELQKRRIDAEIMLAEAEPANQAGPYAIEGGIAVIDRAKPAKVVVSPNRKFIIILGALAGLGVGFAWTLASEFYARSLVESQETTQNMPRKNS